MRGTRSLALVTIAAIVMGSDYAIGLFFPEWGAVLSLNRVVFLLIAIYDVLVHPTKYILAGIIYVVGALVLVACLPFLMNVTMGTTAPFERLDELFALVGQLVYFSFFYVNCQDKRAASRVCVVLFTCTLFLVLYLMGYASGILGDAAFDWRGDVVYTRASGDFDPNIVVLYLIPCFAFGPLLALHSSRTSHAYAEILLVALLGLASYAVMQLNSRAGTVALGGTLMASLFFRIHLETHRGRTFRLKAMLFTGFIVGSLALLQLGYGIFDTIIAVYGATDLGSDYSFSTRANAYRYLLVEFLKIPNLLGSKAGYAPFWALDGKTQYPHCTLVDIYIKGGLLYLCVYGYLYTRSASQTLHIALRKPEPTVAAVSASLFCFLLGFLPLLMTLSIDRYKLTWGIMGAALGYTACLRRAWITRETPAQGDEVAQCPQLP